MKELPVAQEFLRWQAVSIEEGSGVPEGAFAGTPGTQPSSPPHTFVKEFVTVIPKRIIWLKITEVKITEIVANKISFNYWNVRVFYNYEAPRKWLLTSETEELSLSDSPYPFA